MEEESILQRTMDFILWKHFVWQLFSIRVGYLQFTLASLCVVYPTKIQLIMYELYIYPHINTKGTSLAVVPLG